MGYSTAAATSIIIVGLILSMASLYSSTNQSLERVSKAMQDRTERSQEDIHGQIEINNVDYNSSRTNLTINATNKGNTVFKVKNNNKTINVLLDGVLYSEVGGTIETYLIDGVSSDLWRPETTLIISMDLGSRPNRVKLVSKPGIMDYYSLS